TDLAHKQPAAIARIERGEYLLDRICLAVADLDDVAERGQQVVAAVLVIVHDVDADAGDRAELRNGEAADWLAAVAAEDVDLRPAAWTRAGDDFGLAVAIEIAGGDVDTAVEGRGVGHPLRPELERHAVPHADVRPTADSGGRDDVGEPVAVHVAG